MIDSNVTSNSALSNDDKSGLCECGRQKSTNKNSHCPACGSISRWPLIRLALKRKIAMYRCKHCGQAYSLNDKCNAPKYVFRTLKERRVYDGIADGIETVSDRQVTVPTEPEERQRLIASLFGK